MPNYFLLCYILAIPMYTDVHMSMYMLSAYIWVHVAPLKCEKCSLKCEILVENSRFSIFIPEYFRSCYILTMPMGMYVHVAIYRLWAYT